MVDPRQDASRHRVPKSRRLGATRLLACGLSDLFHTGALRVVFLRVRWA